MDKARRTSDHRVQQRVGQAFRDVVEAMRQQGFDIGLDVQVSVDPKLPFMGYTMPQGKGFRVTVSGNAVESGMLEGLLAHEMSHIYRMRTNHPSHNYRIINAALNSLGQEASRYDYQQKILGELVNNVEDLYADDIAIKVMRSAGFASDDTLSRFFQRWVKDKPEETGNPVRDRWVSASIMANNARAIAQMTRHQIKDPDGRAEAMNEKFLSSTSPEISTQYEYFLNTLINLKENLTPEEYRKLLGEYLNRFLDATKVS